MDQTAVVNSALNDLKKTKIILEKDEHYVFLILSGVYAAAWESRGKELVAHNKKKVFQYNRDDELIGIYNSVVEAAKANGCSRDVIDDSIHGRVALSRKGYYFRYADKHERDS